MKSNLKKILQYYLSKDISSEQEEMIRMEMKIIEENQKITKTKSKGKRLHDIYQPGDSVILQNFKLPSDNISINLQTLEELLRRDSLREKDGFKRRILLGKFIKPSDANGSKVVVVPSTTEPKFYHDDSIGEENDEDTGGSGNGEEGEVIGEQQAEPEEGEGQGAGQGQGAEHDISTDAFDLGKVLTEEFQLPNLKDKGKKRTFTKYNYELTDRNRGFGQILDKKATIKKVIQTNIMLGRIKEAETFNPEDLVINPKDQVYRILSKEKTFESQAIVFFIRDYSGSMQGKPSEIVSTQHLLIFSWLMYQYKNNVLSRFILHDTQAKEVVDFRHYYTSQVAGGTEVSPAFELLNKIIEDEELARDYNIYVFYGTDGDDWDNEGEKIIPALKKSMEYCNRIGITVVRNSWSSDKTTTVENYLQNSDLLSSKSDLLKLDAFNADEGTEERIIEGIRKLVS